MAQNDIVQKLWNLCDVLRDDSILLFGERLFAIPLSMLASWQHDCGCSSHSKDKEKKPAYAGCVV